MKKKLLDRRGAAIELAIMMMVFSIFITTIVLTTALLQNSHKAKAELGIKQDIFLEQLGEDFVDAVLSGGMNTGWKPEGYKDITFVDTTERHNFGDKETIKATCTEDGRIIQTCLSCGYQKLIETLPALGHNTTGIDCHEANGACKDCGALVPVEHSWVSDTAASCTEEIIADCKCTVCGEEERRVLSALGHSFGDEVITKEPNCTEKGEKTFTCTICGHNEEQEIEAMGHAWDDGVAKDGKTCADQDGIMLFSCTNKDCNATEERPIPHKEWDEGVVTKEPSHTEEGVMTYTCVCGATELKPIEKTKEHSFNENDICVCGARRNHYILTVITAGKDAYKLHIQGIDAVENPQGIPEGSSDVIDACGSVVLKISIEWSETDNAYKITEWSKK
ncbi:MAG: hypothetical protein E7461_00895 [Ruminococcaceae bacterium]|nr:hypothetical protein [Oscillospiraceae bacterium]